MTALPLRPLAWAGAGVRRRFRRWWQARLRRTDTLLLTQRNVYILPTRAGLLFAATLVVLLLASINYQLSLGYVLTFLLAGSGAVSMQLTHDTLRGLTLHLRAPQPVHAGDAALLEAVLTSAARARHGVGLRIEASDDERAWSWTDVPAGAQATARVSFVPPARGRHDVPALVVETRFPLGLFRAWSVWQPAVQVLVYPRTEQPPAPLPAAPAVAAAAGAQRRADGGDSDGVRLYRRGDSLRRVLWKKAARSGELVARDSSATVQRELWLDYQECGARDAEARLSRLAAWVIEAGRAGVDHGLRLPGVEIEPAQGDAHRRRCLEALALWR
jgi:uncharacterized protein (DUF58 family)